MFYEGACFVFTRVVKASSTAGTLSALCFCLVSVSPGPSMCPQPSEASRSLLQLCRASSSSCAGWRHTGTPGLPPSSLSYSGENLGMLPVTVKSDDRIRTPKSSKLLPKFPLALFLGMPKPNLPGIQTQYTTHCLYLQLLLGLQDPPGAPSPSRWS